MHRTGRLSVDGKAIDEFAFAFQLAVGLCLNPLSILSVAEFSLEVQSLFHTLVASSNLDGWHDIFLLADHVQYQRLREPISLKRIVFVCVT